jgi:hypothetical protein
MIMKQITIQKSLLNNGSTKKHVCMATSGYSIKEKNCSMWAALRCYKQGQLAVTVRELLGFSHCELLLLEAGS